jgi:surface protein
MKVICNKKIFIYRFMIYTGITNININEIFAYAYPLPLRSDDITAIRWAFENNLSFSSYTFDDSRFSNRGGDYARLMNYYDNVSNIWRSLFSHHAIITSLTSFPVEYFISSWKTNNTGISSNNQIKLPLYNGGDYNFVVDWGDTTTNTITTWNQIEVTHTYPSAGTYIVKISGNLNGWRFNNGGDKLKILNVLNWGILQPGNLGNQFLGCSNMTCAATDPLLTGTTNMLGMFRSCTLFNGNIGNWNMSGVTSTSYMLFACSSFNQNINNWNMSTVTDTSAMFRGCSIFNQNLNSWNVSNVTNMFNMFQLCSAFNGNISAWNVSNVQNMQGMFSSCSIFNQNLSAWDVKSVTTMYGMFNGCILFNSNLSAWNVGMVQNFNGMFNGCVLFNQDLSLWNVSSALYTGQMFAGCSIFTSDLSAWNVSNVTDMNNMFQDCHVFNSNLSGWTTSAVTDMNYMFQNCYVFNSDLSTWDVSLTTIMSHMFENCYMFNSDLSAWNIVSVTTGQTIHSSFYMMFDGSSLSTTNYSALLNGWSLLTVNPDLSLGSGTIKYDLGAVAARLVLTDPPNNWTITDGGLV